jgi:hypothetical protein
MSNERKPLLSDKDAIALGLCAGDGKFVTPKSIAMGIRDYYEALIDSGKLRVVEEVVENIGRSRDFSYFECSGCHYEHDFEVGAPDFTFCPNCGNPIKQ